MLSKIKELAFNPELRKWFFYKLLHPTDSFPNPRNMDFSYLKFSPSYPEDELRNKISCLEADFASDGTTLEVRLASCLIRTNDFLDLLQAPSAAFSPEDQEALFRFNGLLLLSLDDKLDSKTFNTSVSAWTNGFQNPVAQAPYVISERLSNLALLFIRHSFTLSEIIKSAVLKDVSILVSNLEYFGERLTGNHLTNNGRGIAWGGYLLGRKDIIIGGLRLILEESNRILSPDGVLREGSTNYQSLICRTYLEASMLSEVCEDSVIESSLAALSVLVCEATELLHPQGVDPCIGDISPDFPKEFFRNAHFFNLSDGKELKATGWLALFRHKIYVRELEISKHLGSFVRVQKKNAVLLAHINQQRIPILTGHAHRDSGSFVILFDGNQVIIDLGRLDYNSFYDPYLESRSHNTLSIDGSSLEIANRGVYGPRYLQKVLNHFELNYDPAHWSVQFKSTWRKQKVQHTRTILLQDDNLIVKDNFSGQGKRQIEIFFHFASADLAASCGSDSGEYVIVECTRATNYGKKDKAFRAILKLEVTLPAQVVTRISYRGNKIEEA